MVVDVDHKRDRESECEGLAGAYSLNLMMNTFKIVFICDQIDRFEWQ